MPHGGPDWGTGGEVKTIYTIEDLGELAARLGSIVTFDRRGNVVFLDDFESGLEKWMLFLGGVGANVQWSTETAMSGGFCAKFTTGSTGLRSAGIHHFLALPVTSCIGMEIAFSLEEDLKEVDFRLEIYDGAFEYDAYILYDVQNDALKYVDSTGVYQTIASGLNLWIYVYTFHILKFVVDVATSKWKRVLVNSTEYSLEGIDMYKFANANAPRFQQRIISTANIAANIVSYVDRVIITQNEP